LVIALLVRVLGHVLCPGAEILCTRGAGNGLALNPSPHLHRSET